MLDLVGPHMKTAEEVAYLYRQLKEQYGPDIQRMRMMRELMNNEMPVPLPELKKDEASTVANLALSGMDQLARRMSSIEPTMYWPNLDPGDEEADQRFKDKPRVIRGWHEANALDIKLGKRARFFLAYATTPVMLRPNTKTLLPEWHVLSPLDTFVPLTAFDDYTPNYSITVKDYTYKDLLNLFDNEAVNSVHKPHDWDYDDVYANLDTIFEVLMYQDEHEYSMFLLGSEAPSQYHPSTRNEGVPAVRLTYARNLLERPLVVCPGRITLDKQLGHFDGIVGMYQTQAALMALTVIAQRKAVWPTQWVEGLPNTTGEPEVVTHPDPYNGIPGEINNGRLNTVSMDTAFRTLEIMDRQEEAMRKEAGIPAEFGGLSSTNIRTGARGAQVMANTIDFTMSEFQRIIARSIKEENKLAIAIDKTYFNRKKTFYIESRSYVGSVEYKPSKLWDADAHVVDYPFAGVDLQNLVIEGGQRVAAGTMSRETFMEMDPAIRDVPGEVQRIHRQGIQDAFISGAQSLAANPEGPMQLPHLARLDQKLAQGKELYQAFNELQEEVQKEQAEMAPPDHPELQQPGMAMPGQGVEQPGEPIPESDTSMNRMSGLLKNMATVQTAQKYRA